MSSELPSPRSTLFPENVSRRSVLARGLQLGLSTAAIQALLHAVPVAASADFVATQPLDWRRAAEPGGTFTYTRDLPIDDLDGHYTYGEGQAGIRLAVTEMLIQYKGDSTSEFEPFLADSWDISEDQTTYTFHLAKDARFHDGDPVTAQHVKESFNRALQLGQSISDVIGRFVPDAEHIEVVDDHTVRFNLGQPQPIFLAAMASAFGPVIVNTRYIEEFKTDDDPWARDYYRDNQPGSGPYKIKEFLPAERVILERNEDWRGGWEGNHFDQIILRIVPEVATRRLLIESGEIDATTNNLTPEDVVELKNNPDLEVITYDSTLASWIAMNHVRLPLEARQGFALAFPYEQVTKDVYRGLYTRSGPIPTTLRGYDANEFLYQTDLPRAKELLAAAGFPEGETFEYIYVKSDPADDANALLFQQNLASIGYNLDILTYDRAQRASTLDESQDALELPHFFAGEGFWPDYNDPYNQLYPVFHTEAIGYGLNVGRFSNPRVDELLDAYKNETDEASATELINEARQLLVEDDPAAIFIGTKTWYTILRNDIEGFQWNGLYLSAYHPKYGLHRTSN